MNRLMEHQPRELAVPNRNQHRELAEPTPGVVRASMPKVGKKPMKVLTRKSKGYVFS